MDFLHRSFLSIKSKKGSFLLQSLILTIVTCLILTGLMIQTASNKATALTKASIGSTVTFQSNPAQFLKNASKSKRPTFKSASIKIADAEKLAKLNHVSSYNFIVSTQGNASNFKAIKSSNASSSASTNGQNRQGPQQGGAMAKMQTGDLSIEGVSSLSALDDFKQGTSSMTSGKTIASSTAKNTAVVNKTLAKENDLKIGSTIKIKSMDKKKTVSLKIIGFYKTSSSTSSVANNFTAMNPYNKIYVPYATANKLKGTTTTIDSAVYTMDDAGHISAFKKAAKSVSGISWSKYTLVSNNSTYKSLVGSISNIGSFSKNLVYIVTIAGLAIISLMVMMQIRNRKYEVGVLMGIGESKSKIISQFIIEILVAAILAFAVSFSVSQPIASVVSDKLNSSYSANSTTSTNQMSGQRGPGGMGGMGGQFGASQPSASAANKLNLDVLVNTGDIFKTMGIATGIAVLSVLLPSIAVMRLKPKEILTRQE